MSYCCAAEQQFNRKVAARDLRNYRKNGPAATTRMLLAALVSGGIEGRTLLDIGGGIGALQHGLLAAGAAHATAVDASSSYLESAREEAERQGHAERVDMHYGDFVQVAPSIGVSDIVTLDRVICCYKDLDAIVKLSAQRSRRAFGLVYPRRTWRTRCGLSIINTVQRLRRSAYRAYAHAPSRVESLLQAEGLAVTHKQRTWLWHVALYHRSTPLDQ